MIKRFIHFTVTGFIYIVLSILCKVDKSEISRLPEKGPCLFVTNHVNFLEVPLIYTCVQPRIVHSLIKMETWKNPFLRFLAGIWHAIPIKRGTADFSAFSAAEQVFKNEGILIMAPEGTRSKTGILQRGHAGAVLLAVHNNVPIYPLVHTGGEKFYTNLKKVRRTAFKFHVGKPFYINTNGEKLDSAFRQKLTTQLMSRIAVLLPEEQRGHYAFENLDFTPNLRDA
ncbi:MAG TPA: lysophospholipid acyltransferase family protein [Treponemataceae bacterium]|nr:lysophospholipid acyltransferase family protein [Treponemataceae bacterium]HQL04422.1 lysophospholipid acyltransferase family protein [Treponemataceae bacterium]